jgi:predicted ATPase
MWENVVSLGGVPLFVEEVTRLLLERGVRVPVNWELLALPVDIDVTT